MTGLHWLALFGVIALAWGLLYMMALPEDLRAGAVLYGWRRARRWRCFRPG